MKIDAIFTLLYPELIEGAEGFGLMYLRPQPYSA
jgi:hypothetical protein